MQNSEVKCGEAEAVAGCSHDFPVTDPYVPDPCTMYIEHSRLISHTAPVTRIKFSPNGQYLASAAMDATVKIWICPSTLLVTIQAHTTAVNDIAWDYTGRYLASVGSDATAKLWKIPDGILLRQLVDNCDSILCCDFHPQLTCVALGLASRQIIFWNMSEKNCTKIMYAHYGSVTSLNYNKFGDLLVSCGSDGSSSLWDSNTRQRIKYFYTDSSSITAFVRFSPSGKMVLQSQLNHCLKLLDVDTGQYINTYTGHENGFCKITSDMFTTPNQSIAISGSEDSFVYIWDLDSCQITQKLDGHEDAVRCVTIHPEKKIIASGSNDRTIIMWETVRINGDMD